LSNARYKKIEPPAEHLNTIFVDMKNKSEANNPKYIRNSRKQNKKIEPDLLSSDSEPERMSDTDICNEENQKNCNLDQGKASLAKNKKSKSIKRNKASKKIQSENSSEDTKSKVEPYQVQKEHESKKKHQTIQEIIHTYQPHVPFWGGNIKYKEKLVKLTNTCTIDNLLYAFWVAHKNEDSFLEQIPLLKHTETIKEIIKNINDLEWNIAKELWIKNIMHYNEEIRKKSITLYGSESNRFIRHINEYQQHHLIQICSENCNRNRNVIIQSNCDKIYFKKINNKVNIYSGFDGLCSECKAPIKSEITFENNPNFLFIESIYSNIFLNDLPKTINIRGISYKILCSTIHQNDHFLSIFSINDYLFKIDDLDRSFVHLENNLKKRKNFILKEATSVSFYYRN
jgi:hypothetical protein